MAREMRYRVNLNHERAGEFTYVQLFVLRGLAGGKSLTKVARDRGHDRRWARRRREEIAAKMREFKWMNAESVTAIVLAARSIGLLVEIGKG